MTSSTEMVGAFYTGFLDMLSAIFPLFEIILVFLFFVFVFGVMWKVLTRMPKKAMRIFK